MSKRTLLALLAVFSLTGAAVILGYLFHIGLFTPIEIETKRMRSHFLVYKEQVGEYKQTVGTVGLLLREMQAVGVQDLKGFAIFYDDPAVVPVEKLKSEAGVILPEAERKRAAGILSRYQSRQFPSMEGAVATFPLKNSFSVLLGAYRVYPKMTQYVESMGYTPTYSLEIYDFGKTTTYFMPFSDQKI